MKPLSISAGRAADGEDKYFERMRVETKIWSKIKRGEHLLLAAPRRTGKSSVLKNLERNPKDGYLAKYKSVIFPPAGQWITTQCLIYPQNTGLMI